MLEREGVGQQCCIASGSADGGKCHWQETSECTAFGWSCAKEGRILDPGPRRSPCPPPCSKVGACMSELPLTAVCVICSLKSLMMEISQSP